MTNIRLNDAQLVLLSAAARREDGSLLPPPPSLAEDQPRMTKAIEQLLKKGLVAEQPGAAKDAMWREHDDVRYGVVISDAGRAAINVGEDGGADASTPPTAEPTTPRQTKRAMLIEVLKQEGGASIAEIAAAMSWLPHTTHAALTGLRKAGMTLDSEKVDGTRRYRIVEPA